MFQYLQQQTGQLSIISIPSGADIFIDGIKQLDTTPFITTLPIGQYIYRLVCSGYIDEDVTVDIQNGLYSDARAVLQPVVDET